MHPSPNTFYMWYFNSQIQFYSFNPNTTFTKTSHCSEFLTANETRVSESLYVLKVKVLSELNVT